MTGSPATNREWTRMNAKIDRARRHLLTRQHARQHSQWLIENLHAGCHPVWPTSIGVYSRSLAVSRFLAEAQGRSTNLDGNVTRAQNDNMSATVSDESSPQHEFLCIQQSPRHVFQRSAAVFRFFQMASGHFHLRRRRRPSEGRPIKVRNHFTARLARSQKFCEPIVLLG